MRNTRQLIQKPNSKSPAGDAKLWNYIYNRDLTTNNYQAIHLFIRDFLLDCFRFLL